MNEEERAILEQIKTDAPFARVGMLRKWIEMLVEWLERPAQPGPVPDQECRYCGSPLAADTVQEHWFFCGAHPATRRIKKMGQALGNVVDNCTPGEARLAAMARKGLE